MPLMTRKKILAAKIEVTSGTKETLTAAEAVYNVFDFELQPTIGMTPRMAQGSFSSLSAVPEGYGGTVSFKTHAYGDGAAGVPGWASTFLPACGLVNSAGTFSLKSETPGANVKTLTIGMYVDGLFKVLRGCAGTVKIVCESGKAVVFEWTFTGVWAGVTDVTLPNPTYEANSPIRAANSAFTYGAWSPCYSKLEIDIGNQIYLRPCASASDGAGYAGACIVDRSVTGSFDPESALVATFDYYGKWLSRAEEALSLAFQNSTDQITIAAPKAQITSISQTDRSGVLAETINFQCNRNASAGNDELTIVFDAP